MFAGFFSQTKKCYKNKKIGSDEFNKLVKISERQGKSLEETFFNNDCEKCSRRRYMVETEYEKAFKEYIKEEFGESFV